MTEWQDVSGQGIYGFTPQDLALIGLNDVAYVRAAKSDDGAVAWVIHAADGTPIAVMDDRETAFAAIIQNDMEPLSAH